MCVLGLMKRILISRQGVRVGHRTRGLYKCAGGTHRNAALLLPPRDANEATLNSVQKLCFITELLVLTTPFNFNAHMFCLPNDHFIPFSPT